MSKFHSRPTQGPRSFCLYLLPLLLWGGVATAQALDSTERHYDARATAGSARAVAQPRALSSTTQNLSADVQELSTLELDEITGAVRSLSSERGFLSAVDIHRAVREDAAAEK